MYKNAIYCYIKNSQIVNSVTVRNDAYVSLREPTVDQLSMPIRRLVETSVVAVLYVDAHCLWPAPSLLLVQGQGHVT